ncbi:glycosyltransferase [Candidatus Woesebacteria bacterium]|nr:glycosyltransferase [Candidatus Woesebacteria bacterium]
MKPQISVIIPTYNEEQYLPKLLDDLSHQTSPNFEVIISDGSSTDKTLQKATLFKSQLNLLLLQSPKQQVSAQRNFGAHHAKGSYIIFLDADMRVKNNFIEQLHTVIAHSKRLLFIPAHIPDSQYAHDELLYKIQTFFIEMSHHTKKPFTYGPTVLFLKSLFDHLGGYDEGVVFAEDQEIIQRARDNGVIAELLPDVLVYFSTRRYEKEGRLNVMRKYLMASVILLTEGKIDKEIFTYEMGGSADYLIEKKKKEGFPEVLKSNWEKLKLFLEE